MAVTEGRYIASVARDYVNACALNLRSLVIHEREIRQIMDLNLHGFRERFLAKIESAFSADIICCEECYSDFVAHWPALYLHDTDFQSSSMEADMFYRWSGLDSEYTEEEYKLGMECIECPRCGASLTSNFWVYDLSQDLPQYVESQMEEVAELAKQAPFLVLSHPFASEVWTAISKESEKIPSIKLSETFYRARTGKVPEPLVLNLGHPPARFVSEGRFNHAGRPVLYLATSPQLAFSEMGAPEEGVYMAELKLCRCLRILDLSHRDLEDSLIKGVFYSSLVSAPSKGDGWDRPEYVFSRFVGDCVFAAGLDGIKYQSAHLSNGWNYVVFSRGVWEGLYEIQAVKPYTINDVPERLRDHVRKKR